jgi:RNA polymerase sigma-70 factor (ECF subfamily)
MTTEASNPDRPLDDLDRYRDGDQAAFLRLWERHLDDFARWLRRRLGKDEHAAEDLLNDTVVKLVTPGVRSKYDRNKPWGGWAFKILCNLTIDFLRRRVRAGAVTLEPESLADPDLCVTDDGFAEDLHVCLKGLSPRLRELMVQRYLEGRQQTDIARDMALSTATVSKNLDKARILLARCLEEKGHGGRLR